MGEKVSMRVQKWLSQNGVCSRREAERLVLAKKVFINQKIASIGEKVEGDEEIRVEENVIRKQGKKIYYLFNKPPQCLTMRKTDPFGRQTIMSFLPKQEYIFPIGRLDYDTSGVLLVSNDGHLTNLLLHPRYQIKKIYKVNIDRCISKKELDFLNSDQVLVDKKPSKQKVCMIGPRDYKVEIWSGSNRHIKKLFMLLSRKVLNLERIEFAGLKVSDLKPGEWRKLNPKEVEQLFNLVKSV